MDWYGILGVSPFADEETVRKQYRKLAITLQPDKNKSLGADGAFKLVSKAWSLLSDKTKRLEYNQKRSFKKAETFWTLCNKCRAHYEYLRVYLNHKLLCGNCNEAFVAVERAPPPNVFKPSNLSSHQQHQNSTKLSIHFFKLILQTNLQRLKIPNEFTRRYGVNLSNPVLIKPPDDTKWKVYWKNINGEIWFQKGWKSFTQNYSLGYGYGSLVVFEYHDGTSNFNVVVLGQNALEIDYGPSCDTCDDENDNIGHSDDESFEILDEKDNVDHNDDKSVMILDELSSPRPHKKARVLSCTTLQSDSESESEDVKKKKKPSKISSEKKESSGRSKTGKTTATNKSCSLPKKSSHTRPNSDDDIDESPKVFSKKKNVQGVKQTIRTRTPTKYSSKSKEKTERVTKGKGKTKEKSSSPSDDQLRNAICDILKEIDFNTATFSDILKLLAKQFDVDVTSKKAAIKLMIQKELEKLAEEADDYEEDEEDAEKNEGQSTGQKA